MHDCIVGSDSHSRHPATQRKNFCVHRSERQLIPVMSSQVREKTEVSATDLLQMQTRLRMLTAEYEKLSRENTDLRARPQSLSDESRRFKDYNDLVSAKDRYSKLSEQLKHEKTHLVETVLELSEEMDSLQREYSSDRILLSRKTHYHQEMERQANACRTKMEIQISDALTDSGLHKDDALRKKIEAIIRSTRPAKVPLPDYVSARNGANPNRIETGTAPGLGEQRQPDFLDAAALRTMEAQRARLSDGYEYEMRGESALVMGRAGSNRSGPRSIRSNQSRRILSMSPGKKRGKQAMERDETESVISSVSTHRSVKSMASASMSWFRSPNGDKIMKNSKRNSGGGGAITVENLAILNILNGDDHGRASVPVERLPVKVEKQQKTPGDRNADSAWWPKLF